MCKANATIESKVSDLVELLKMQEDLNAEIEGIKDEIKAYMSSTSV